MGTGLIRTAVNLDTVPAAIDNMQMASRIELHRGGAPEKHSVSRFFAVARLPCSQVRW